MKRQPTSRDDSHISIPSTLAQLYRTKLYPLEEYTRFQEFHSPLLDDAHFTSRPMVLLIGQYSTGKTTFLRSVSIFRSRKKFSTTYAIVLFFFSRPFHENFKFLKNCPYDFHEILHSHSTPKGAPACAKASKSYGM